MGRWDAGCNFVETAASPECRVHGSIAGVTLAACSQYHLVSVYQAYSGGSRKQIFGGLAPHRLGAATTAKRNYYRTN